MCRDFCPGCWGHCGNEEGTERVHGVPLTVWGRDACQTRNYRPYLIEMITL